jgi:hypothetical protein
LDKDLADLSNAFSVIGNREAVAPPGWEEIVKKFKGEGNADPSLDVENEEAGIDDFANAGGISYKGSAKRVGGPRLKENWGDGGAYNRDLEAETAEELHALVRGFNGEEVDWSLFKPQAPQATQEIMAGKVAVDDEAKNYYEKYFSEDDYGKKMVKDVLKRDRQVKKEEGSEKKEDKKEAQMAPPAPPAPGPKPPAGPGAPPAPGGAPVPGATKAPAGPGAPPPAGAGDSVL